MSEIELQERPIAAEGPAGPGDADGRAVLRGKVVPWFLRDELLTEIFSASVARRPGHAAMITLERHLTYAQVDRQAEAIARGLVAHGAGPGKVVGLWMARGPELLIAQIAIAKTGAAWLPFDADAPIERISVCLGDAEAVGLLVSEEFAIRAHGHPACPVLVDSTVAQVDGPPVDARAAGATPDHPAYLIYTSGSTGVPKGIVITGRNICHYLRSANDVYGINDGDVVFQGASVASTSRWRRSGYPISLARRCLWRRRR